MFCVASLVPSPPVLVPELGGAAGAAVSGEVAGLRAAVLGAAGALADRAARWVVVGVDAEVTSEFVLVGVSAASDGTAAGASGAGAVRAFGPETVGSFRGYGVDVRVGLSGISDREPSKQSANAAPTPAGDSDGVIADPTLPLPVLIGGWLRETVAPEAVAEARVLCADAAPADCLEFGRRLRAELDARPEPCGVLVVADGAATLSLAAPRYFDERAQDVQAGIDRALDAGDRSALAALDSALCAELAVGGRAAYQVLAGLFVADVADPRVETRYAAAPFGVGYHASVWLPGERT
ncbi:hypothetical protein [Nocardia inohanensis]|uniref:hypothetical protein n=1 Tax=Nocardia inohanensis TaxID=209246 RepID=UPI00082E9F91|nr:hypothetical protein [Nocardia inohanensis]